MQPTDPGTDRPGDAGPEAGGSAAPGVTREPPPAIVLIDAYLFARRHLAQQMERASEASEAFLDAERELRAHIEREGPAVSPDAVYSLSSAGSLRWRRKPEAMANWRAYATRSPGPNSRP